MTERFFVVARNPDPASRLGYLVRLPIDGAIVLKAREPWPTTSRVYCHDAAGEWPAEPVVIQACAVRSCRRRGIAIDLVLERGRNNRSQFVFTHLKNGRPAIFWQTAKTARGTKPGARVPVRRASGQVDLVIAVDSRERYGYRFSQQQASVTRQTLRAGDYAVLDEDGCIIAAVERKTLDNLVAGLVDNSLSFQLAELADLARAAAVVEGRYGDLLGLEHTTPGWVLELVAHAQVRHPTVPIVFAGSRKLAEEWTYRYLGAARAELD